MSRTDLSVVISNRNDTVMLSITVRSCLEAFRGIDGNCEVVICDNSDIEYRDLLSSVLPTRYLREGKVRLLHQPFPCLFSARETAIEQAYGDYVVCLDSHMLVGHNSLSDLLSFARGKSGDPRFGFAHAPICWLHQHHDNARHDRSMEESELGSWGRAYDKSRKMTWKGMPWICRRDWFLDYDKGLGGYGSLSRHRVSWGGGDMLIGLKPWLLGFENWAVATSPCYHIGPFPKIDSAADKNSTAVGRDKYRLYKNSGKYPHTFGFLVASHVLGGDRLVERNLPALRERFGRYIDFDKWLPVARELARDERQWLLERRKMSFWDLIDQKPWEERFGV